MAVFASTADPKKLARRMVEAVKRGTIDGWQLTSGHLRHADPRASGNGSVAFFDVEVTGSAVKLSLVPPKKSEPLEEGAYAYHHGRLTEILLAHFSDVLTRVQCTPFPGSSNA